MAKCTAEQGSEILSELAFQEGQLAWHRGDASEAEKAMEASLRLDPTNQNAINALVIIRASKP